LRFLAVLLVSHVSADRSDCRAKMPRRDPQRLDATRPPNPGERLQIGEPNHVEHSMLIGLFAHLIQKNP
jgi:hypothetical protein